MSASESVVQYGQLMLPWSDDRKESSRFFWVFAVILCLFVPLSVWIPSIVLPVPEREVLEKVPPKLAQILLERKKVAPPPPKPEPIKKEEPKPEKKVPPKVEKKVEKKPPETVKKVEPPKPKVYSPQEIQKAQEVAKSSGLLALQDDLSDMRSAVDTAALGATTAKTIGSGRKKSEVASVAGAGVALRGSGGVQGETMTSMPQAVALSDQGVTQLEETAKETQLAEDEKAIAAARSAPGRSLEEVRQVFDRSKTSLFNIYNRALRKDPTLQGKLLLEITIQPDGSVTECKVVSSELNDAKLERKITNRIRLINFGPQKVETLVVSWPIVFLPSAG